MSAGLIAGRRSPRFCRFFAGYAHRLLRRRFASVRLMHGGREVLGRADRHTGPVLMAMNHAAWWDPLVALLIVTECMPRRIATAPMDLAQFRHFRFMRRLGLFGLDPRRADAQKLLVAHVAHFFAREPRPLLVITPQAAFTDVRAPMRLRPGAAAVAAAHPDALVVVLSCEYTFWQDARPEILLRVARCPPPPRPSVTAWQRQLTDRMTAEAASLAAAVIARDAGAFEPLLEPAGARVHPVYDLLLRLRGRRTQIGRPAA